MRNAFWNGSRHNPMGDFFWFLAAEVNTELVDGIWNPAWIAAAREISGKDHPLYEDTYAITIGERWQLLPPWMGTVKVPVK